MTLASHQCSHRTQGRTSPSAAWHPFSHPRGRTRTDPPTLPSPALPLLPKAQPCLSCSRPVPRQDLNLALGSALLTLSGGACKAQGRVWTEATRFGPSPSCKGALVITPDQSEQAEKQSLLSTLPRRKRTRHVGCGRVHRGGKWEGRNS
jgi:hypothetical protein